MPHDQLFKELLQAFFREFMELFYSITYLILNIDTQTIARIRVTNR